MCGRGVAAVLGALVLLAGPAMAEAALGLPIADPAAASQTVVFDNFGSENAFTSLQPYPAGQVPGGPTLATALSFVPTTTVGFESVEVVVNRSQGTGALIVQLRADAAGLPGEVMETITVSGIAGATPVLATAVSAINPVLTADTPYWIVLTAGLGDFFSWHNSPSDVDSPLTVSASGGSSWSSPAPPGEARAVLRVNGSSAEPGFTVHDNPTDTYLPATCRWDLKHYADFAELTTLETRSGKPSMCGARVAFDTIVEKRKVPRSWSRWSSPPFAEVSRPDVLWSNGETSLTIRYAESSPRAPDRLTVGLEAQPNAPGLHTIVAEFYDSDDDLLGTISREVDGTRGARLFAATTGGEEIAKVIVHSDVDFAIAQLRVTNPSSP